MFRAIVPLCSLEEAKSIGDARTVVRKTWAIAKSGSEYVAQLVFGWAGESDSLQTSLIQLSVCVNKLLTAH